jgi:hypothetical protein
MLDRIHLKIESYDGNKQLFVSNYGKNNHLGEHAWWRITTHEFITFVFPFNSNIFNITRQVFLYDIFGSFVEYY